MAARKTAKAPTAGYADPEQRAAYELARDLILTTINAGHLPGDAESFRHFVRMARAVRSEVAKPTQATTMRRVPVQSRGGGDEDGMPDLSGMEELEV